MTRWLGDSHWATDAELFLSGNITRKTNARTFMKGFRLLRDVDFDTALLSGEVLKQYFKDIDKVLEAVADIGWTAGTGVTGADFGAGGSTGVGAGAADGVDGDEPRSSLGLRSA